jgi:N-methylhydantoinase A/oxoprolinase/acetone carboxylase beta subunit
MGVGIDTGGTFTDLRSDERRGLKPEKLFPEGVMPSDLAMIVHGTTVATNALLELR